MQYKPINQDELNEQKAKDYLELKNQTLQVTLLDDPKIARYLDFADYLLSYHFQQTLHKRAHEKLLVEMFNSEYILSKLYGLELHKIKEFFIRFGNKIKIAGFVLMLIKLIQFQLEEVPFMINGLRELAEKIAQDGIITFESFVSFYMSCGEDQEDLNVQHAQYKIRESKIQDTLYHKHEIQKAIYAKSIQKIALLEENQPQIFLLGMDFSIYRSLGLDNPEMHYIILDFDYAESIKEFCFSLSNNHILFLSFLDQLHSKKLVQCDYLLTKIQFLVLLDQWGSVTTNQQLILWQKKAHTQTKVQLQLQGGKIQSIIELVKNEMICLQTDMKRVHIFNPKLEQLIIIQDSLLIQTFLFYEPGQCCYSINYTHKIQKWLIEENGVDYTKDKTIQICKPEYTVLAIGFVQDLLVTYDSSNQIRVFDTEDFKKLATFKKILKPTNHMKIIEISKYQFIIIGNRISSFEIDVRIEEKQQSHKGNDSEREEDYDAQLKATKQLLMSILKNQPQVINFRGTKHQDQIESILEQIRGAKNQLLPKVKVKETPIYSELPEEYIRDKIEEIEKNMHSNKLLKERIFQSSEPAPDPQPEQIDPKIQMKLIPLQQGFSKIDHKHNQSEQNGSKIASVRQLQNNSKLKKKLNSSKAFDVIEKSIRNKMDPLLDTDNNFLFKTLKDDYLNIQSKKSATQSLCYESRYEYHSQRGKLKKELFTTQYKTKGQKMKVNMTPIYATDQTLSRTTRNSRNTTNQYFVPDDHPPPMPLECIPQMEKVKKFYNEAVKAINYVKEQTKFPYFYQ